MMSATDMANRDRWCAEFFGQYEASLAIHLWNDRPDLLVAHIIDRCSWAGRFALGVDRLEHRTREVWEPMLRTYCERACEEVTDRLVRQYERDLESYRD